MNNIEYLKTKQKSLLSQISEARDFRPGNLGKYYRRCGRPNCHCAKDGSPGHLGWMLTRKVKQKTVSRRIPADAVEVTSQQVKEYQRFMNLVRELTETNESLCDLQLQSKRSKKKR